MTRASMADHARVLLRHPGAAQAAGALRRLTDADPNRMVVWQMAPDMARHVADLLERGGDAVEGLEAQMRAVDVELDRVRVAHAAAQARDAQAAARRARREVWVWGAICALVAHDAVMTVVDMILRVATSGVVP